LQSLGAFDSVPPLAANFQSLLEADLCVEFGTSAWTAQKAGACRKRESRIPNEKDARLCEVTFSFADPSPRRFK